MQIVFFRGAGPLVIIMPLLVLPFTVGANKLFGDYYSTSHTWPGSVGFIFTGLVTWAVGFWLNRRDQHPDERPKGFRAVFDAPHSFMFLRLDYWGFLCGLPVLGSMKAGRDRASERLK